MVRTKRWQFTRSRRESLSKARRIHQLAVRLGMEQIEKRMRKRNRRYEND